MRNLTFVYVTLLNIAGAGIVFAAYWAGWLIPLFREDNTYLVYVMAAVFSIGMAITWCKAYRMTFADKFARKSIHGVDHRGYLSKMFESYLSRPKLIADKLVQLGLFGTALGFIIAMTHVQGTDPDSIAPLMRELAGALGKTVVGWFLSLWLGEAVEILENRAFQIIEEEVSA